jgi:hypothetical protein
MAATEHIDAPAGVLAAVRADKAAASAAEVRLFEGAAQWAAMHPVESLGVAATVEGSEGELAIAGPGAPLVAEFCVAELAAALGLSTEAGQRYLGDAVEVRYRLPRLWAQVLAGRVAVWKARRIAQATVSLSAAAAAFFDVHVAPVAHRCSFAQLDRTVEEARARFDPAEAEQRRLRAAEARHFDLELRQVSFEGTVAVHGDLDLADALDLEAAIAAGAARLADLGCTESLDVRRSMAAGALARGDQSLDLSSDVTGDLPDQTAGGTHEGGPARQLTIYVHLGDDAVAGVENTRSVVSVEQVRNWCATAGTSVTVRPVVDLNTPLHGRGHDPGRRLREQVVLTQPTCVFPHCARPSRGCDLDHIVPYESGGATETANLAPLCRRHHRLKTHAAWRYVRTGPASFTWTSPHGHVHQVSAERHIH